MQRRTCLHRDVTAREFSASNSARAHDVALMTVAGEDTGADVTHTAGFSLELLRAAGRHSELRSSAR